jgi:biopolymer transport protein TolR
MALYEPQEPVIAQINITPLVDVMLVLLVIFMVTAPILQQGVNVSLPKAAAGPLSSQNDQLVVAVTSDGRVQLNDALLTVEELGQQLGALIQQQPDRAVRLRADKAVPYGRVAEVIAAVRSAGVQKIGMVTEPKEGR